MLSLFAGLALNQNIGNAFFVGPTLAIAFQGGSDVELHLDATGGRSRFPASAPGPFDLDNFERHQFRVKFETPLK